MKFVAAVIHLYARFAEVFNYIKCCSLEYTTHAIIQHPAISCLCTVFGSVVDEIVLVEILPLHFMLSNKFASDVHRKFKSLCFSFFLHNIAHSFFSTFSLKTKKRNIYNEKLFISYATDNYFIMYKLVHNNLHAKLEQ